MRSSIDATGNVTPMTPSFSGNLSANYTTPLFGGRAFASATLSHTSSYYVSGGNRLKMPAYSLLNGSIGWRADGGAEIRLWRSEEHTSELQSLMHNSYDVLCLKKKTKKKIT